LRSNLLLLSHLVAALGGADQARATSPVIKWQSEEANAPLGVLCTEVGLIALTSKRFPMAMCFG
jgi:hypothetical protein